jgi:hypothetical protein
VLVVHVDGRLGAYQGICSHEYFELDKGFLTAGWITCALHLSCFDLATSDVLTWPSKFIDPYGLSGERAMRIVWLGPSWDVRLNSTGVESAARYGAGTAKSAGLGSRAVTEPDGDGLVLARSDGLADAIEAIGPWLAASVAVGPGVALAWARLAAGPNVHPAGPPCAQPARNAAAPTLPARRPACCRTARRLTRIGGRIDGVLFASGRSFGGFGCHI